MTGVTDVPSPLEFFSRLVWLDGRPLLDTIEPYRRRIFEAALYSFEDGRPRYNQVLAGRGKKNAKTLDLDLAALYRFEVWPSFLGNDCYVVASDEGQAADNLDLLKKLIAANPILARDMDVQAKRLVRRDGKGVLSILPAQDVAGAHGKTAIFVGFDEIHTQRTWDLLEALAQDPTRPDTMQWITSYASIYNSPGAPLYDLKKIGEAGTDPRMLFSWYSSAYTTDLEFEDADAEQKANPSMESWPEGREYLAQQKRRLPSHKYRRLHLNEPGLPDGAALPSDLVMDAIVKGRDSLTPQDAVRYFAFVDMSGGSHDSACLAIAHWNEQRGVILDHCCDQGQRPPFDPRRAVQRFARVLKLFRCSRVVGDHYGGTTFGRMFQDEDILYETTPHTKHSLYEFLEVKLTTGEVELLDRPQLQEQLLGLVWRGSKIDHQSGAHDDWANAAAGAVQLAGSPTWQPDDSAFEIWDESSLSAQLHDLAAQGITGNAARQRTVPGRIYPWSSTPQSHGEPGALGPYIV